jgi:hypothetical protein
MEDEPTTELLDRNGWTLDEALDDFTRKTHATLIGLGKTPLVWQEMVSAEHKRSHRLDHQLNSYIGA